MAKYRTEPHGTAYTWAASDSINLELAPKPYTITRMLVVVLADITTTTETPFSDYWDRLLSTLSLSGGGKTYFGFTNMRAAYHSTRFSGVSTRRPTVAGNTQTNFQRAFGYMFHFGRIPFWVNPKTGRWEDNPFDLTGGIPPVMPGNLTLTGTTPAAAGTMGTNVTINTASRVQVYLYGVQPERGDPVDAWMPRATPRWNMRTPTPTATSGPFTTQDDVPNGDYLAEMMIMLTNGTNAPRDDAVLTSLELYNQLENGSIWRVGGIQDNAFNYRPAEILSQARMLSLPPSEDANGSVGVPVVTQSTDEGLVWLPVSQYVSNADPRTAVYGADLRNVGTGALQLRYGVADAAGITMDVVYRRWELNPDHPSNRGLV